MLPVGQIFIFVNGQILKSNIEASHTDDMQLNT